MRQYGIVTTADRSRDLKTGTVLPVWAATVIGAVIVGVASPHSDYFTWLSVAMASVIVVTFAVQLATLTKIGFLDRVMASVGGAALILAVATGVLALLRVLNG